MHGTNAEEAPMTPPGSLGIAVVGWQAISPLGIGAQSFDEGAMQPDPVELHPLHASADEFPQEIAYRPAYFETASLLGAKGIRTMDRTTALAVCTAKLLHGERPIADDAESQRLGFVLGTSTGSIRSTSDFTRESLVQERPFLVNPALFPNTVMNCAAGQCGIWFKARAVNATISGGRLSGLLAIKYAAQALRRGYADRLFTGAVEELCPQTAWPIAS
jgi:3-oxoacyl-[acyl-carrier-protein] synthase II